MRVDHDAQHTFSLYAGILKTALLFWTTSGFFDSLTEGLFLSKSDQGSSTPIMHCRYEKDVWKGRGDFRRPVHEKPDEAQRPDMAGITMRPGGRLV